MEPVSLILTALAAGAAAGLKDTAGKVIADSYDGIKSLIKRKFSGKISVDKLEADPSSKAAQEDIIAELTHVGADKDNEVLNTAKRLLEELKQHSPEVFESVGVKLSDISGASLTIENISARGTGVLVGSAKIEGDIKISGVKSGTETLDNTTKATSNVNGGSAGIRHELRASLRNVKAGENIIFAEKVEITESVSKAEKYLALRGPENLSDFANGPLTPADLTRLEGPIEVDDLIKKLLRVKDFSQPIPIKVSGTLFPCALLAAGWWDRHDRGKKVELQWHDSVQSWLFHGFDLWGPSWDFTWVDLDTTQNPYVIAQLGSGDEADSIPVLIPRHMAFKLRDFFQENWGGGEVEISALLGHRSHFAASHESVELVGGVLDYCLWIDADNNRHGVTSQVLQTSLYSGYLWKCVIPKSWYQENSNPTLNKVYFIWEHTNFRDPDAIRYNLDSLDNKERYLQRMNGDLLLLQKSSEIVPGKEAWPTAKFHDVFARGKKKII